MLTIDLNLHPSVITISTERGAEASHNHPYSGFNACHYTGDDPAHIDRSRLVLVRHLGICLPALIIPRQTHSANVRIISSIPVDDAQLQDIDALVTPLNDVALCINTADCVPLLMADVQAGIIAAAHCGWRGIVNDLIPETINAMVSLGATPADIIAVMGPSICPECFEVGPEVADIFNHAFPGSTDIIEPHTPRPHINLPAAITARLRPLGVPPRNVTPPPVCSRCNPTRFFSARASGIASGRTLSLILRPTPSTFA